VIREFARKQMNTTDVRLHPSLNGAVWANGIKAVPHRLRIRLARKRNESEDAKEKLYTLISHVPMSNFKGIETETVEE
jgi:large subunit ribosomal protein L31e